MAVNLFDVGFHAGDGFFGLVGVELEDTRHLDFHQPQDVVLGHLAYEGRVVGRQAQVDVLAGGVHVRGLFELAVLVDALFDEYFFERGEVQAFHDFATAYLEFAAKQGQGVVYGLAQHVAHGEEVGLLSVDDAAVG